MKYDIEFIKQDGFVFDNEDDALFFAYYCDKYVIKKFQSYYIVIDLTILYCLSKLEIYTGAGINDIIVDFCGKINNIEIKSSKVNRHGEFWDNAEINRRKLNVICAYISKNCEVEYHILKLPQFELGSDLYD